MQTFMRQHKNLNNLPKVEYIFMRTRKSGLGIGIS